MSRALIWSFGGGTQSVAIAVLVAQGKLPKPELTVIADTGREASETWEYLDEHVRPLLGTVGVEVETAPHDLATVDLYGKNGDILLPMFTGNGGKLPTFCSTEWKKNPIRRYLRKRGYGPDNPATMWLGISVDEIHRAKPSGVQWLEYDWPLLTLITLRRDECKRIVTDAGLPSPPRSSCWMCPHRNEVEWKRLRDHYRTDWSRAVALEDMVREHDDDLYLHRSGVPLWQADLNDDQAELFAECDSGYCFV